jgi:glycosyltransferase involved in cell wall biosynthesis
MRNSWHLLNQVDMTPSTLISVLVPLYNEEEFIGTLLERVIAAALPDTIEREIIVVDDGSTDSSVEVVEEVIKAHPRLIRLIRHDRNRGKGAAVRTAIDAARGTYCIIQDADLEYDPAEYPVLLRPLLRGEADVVYGSRFMVVGERRVLYFWHAVANWVLTNLCNVISDLNLTDMETGYKAFRTSFLQSIPIRNNRFGLEPELTIKIAKRQVRIYETPISYHGRTYDEGKKIGWKDAVDALRVILRNALTTDLYKDPGGTILHSLSVARRFNSWMADTIRPFVGSRVLEIGAGIGNLTRALVPGRRLYIAGDIEAEHLARLRTRFSHRPTLQVRHCDLTDPATFEPFAGAMDTAVCLNVLEHVDDDMNALRNIYSALMPGGRAIILVPQGMALYGTLDKALGHYRRYSRDELCRKISDTGFAVDRVLEFNRVSAPGWYVSGCILKRQTIGINEMRLFDSMVWLWKTVDSALPWPATSLIVIARRP